MTCHGVALLSKLSQFLNLPKLSLFQNLLVCPGNTSCLILLCDFSRQSLKFVTWHFCMTIHKHIAHAGGKLPLPEAAGIALQVLQGLEELHSWNIVHDNLKPSNILLDMRRQDVTLSDCAVTVKLHQLPQVPASKAAVHYT